MGPADLPGGRRNCCRFAGLPTGALKAAAVAALRLWLLVGPPPAVGATVPAAPPSPSERLRPRSHRPLDAAGAYGLLRASSDRAGSTVGSIESVQAGLNEIQQDLSVEYTDWKLRRKEHFKERDRLQQDVAQLQAIIAEQRSLQEEKVRLKGQVLLLEEQGRADAETNRRARQQWELRREGLQTEIQHLQGQAKAAHLLHKTHLAAEANTTAELRNHSRSLEQHILLLGLRLGQLRDLAAKQKLKAKGEEVRAVKQAQALQQQIKDLQRKMNAQAQLRAEQERLADQTARVMAQRNQLQADWKDCEGQLKQLDANIDTWKRSIGKSRSELVMCQSLEGRMQHFQDQLNRCKAKHRAGS